MADVPRGGEWAERPGLARLVRGAVFIAPVLVSAAVTRFVVVSVRPADLGVNRWVWLVGVIAVSMSSLILADRLARQLLPLAALLRLSLVFPEEAPSRFRVAMRRSTTKSLERRMQSSPSEARYLELMLELVARLSKHDRLTRGHMERVKAYCELIGEELGLSSEDMHKLRWAALLHDVGKLKVPARILQKNGRPTDSEWEILKSHPGESVLLLAPLSGWLGDWRHAADQHHERWDGGGYPLGLSGQQIHLSGRICAVADAYDVMTSARSYKKPMPAKVARAEIARCAGSQFDPQIARAFLNVSVGRLRLVLGPVSWLANLPAALAALAPAAAPVASGLTALTIAASSIGGVFDVASLDTPGVEVAAPRVEPEPTTTTFSPASTSPGTTVAGASSGPTLVPTTTTAGPAPTTTASPPPSREGGPSAGGAALSGPEDQPIGIILSASSSAESISFALTVGPGRGAVTLGAQAATGGVHRRDAVYLPSRDFFGSDAFEYSACDTAGRCATARVTLTITPVNDAPLAAAKVLSVPRNGTNTIKAVELLEGAVDPEGDGISLVGVANGEKGVVTAAGGEYTYQAGFGQSGRDFVTFTLVDSLGATSNGVITIDISGSPPSAVPDSLSALTDSSARLLVEANDIDPDGGPVRVVAIDAGVHNAWVDQGRAYLEPRPGFTGTITGTYTIEDSDGLRASSTFTVSVGAPVPLYSGPVRGVGEDKLDGAVVWGQIWIYLDPVFTDAHIAAVDFWVDNTSFGRDDDWTFDLQNKPFDTTKLANGVHLLKINVVPYGGPAIYREFAFTVAN